MASAAVRETRHAENLGSNYGARDDGAEREQVTSCLAVVVAADDPPGPVRWAINARVELQARQARTSHGGLASTVVIGYDVGVTIRRITACGRKWAWRVRPDGPSYPRHVLVRIWPRGAGGDAARLDVGVRFDDPWLNFGPIVTAPAARVAEVFQLTPVTPRLVAAAIAQALARHWDPDAPRYVHDVGLARRSVGCALRRFTLADPRRLAVEQDHA
jgi:hypothetical protein